jgi:hypothetical protein
MSSLRGFTATGVALGSMTGVKNIAFPSVSQTLQRVRTAGDDNDAGTAIYINYTEGPIRVTFRQSVTLRNALLTKSRAGTTDTLTFTKTGVHSYSGAGFVQEVGEVVYDADNDPEFTVVFEPETEWTVAAA